MRRLMQIPLLITFLLLAGAIGLRILTGQSFLDCLYNSVILLTTVGSREPDPMTSGTKIFVMAYLACGLGVFMYSLTQFGQMLFNADLRKVLERRRMESDISKLSRHFIVCGMGRMGETLCEYLESRRQPFVVIDENTSVFDEEFQERKWMYICGDASDDDVLNRAGICNARALTTVLGTDADNLYVVLSARLLCPNLQIVARASDERAAQKMTQAGATRVMNPLSSGAIRMARFMLSPSIENFVEVAETQGVDWEIADVHVPDNSNLVGRKISESGLRDSGIMLLGVRKATGKKLFPPPSDLVIEAGDNLFAFGNSEGVAKLSRLLEKTA
ncbi:MAG: potassium channel protein [Planctomycetaceae bacterium]|nr:potassium channel protein [Planctomycetaceae bacterium]